MDDTTSTVSQVATHGTASALTVAAITLWQRFNGGTSRKELQDKIEALTHRIIGLEEWARAQGRK